MPVEPKVESWAQPGSGKPWAERMQATAKAEAEAEAKAFEAKAATTETKIAKLREDNRMLEIKVHALEDEFSHFKSLRAAAKDDKTLHCSFCYKDRTSIKVLVTGVDANICDECIGRANTALSQKQAEPLAKPTPKKKRAKRSNGRPRARGRYFCVVALDRRLKRGHS